MKLSERINTLWFNFWFAVTYPLNYIGVAVTNASWIAERKASKKKNKRKKKRSIK